MWFLNDGLHEFRGGSTCFCQNLTKHNCFLSVPDGSADTILTLNFNVCLRSLQSWWKGNSWLQFALMEEMNRRLLFSCEALLMVLVHPFFHSLVWKDLSLRGLGDMKEAVWETPNTVITTWQMISLSHTHAHTHTHTGLNCRYPAHRELDRHRFWANMTCGEGPHRPGHDKFMR